MPTYEYRCLSCGYQYETREGFDAPSRQDCPQCGVTASAKRLLFPPPIVFKGSGFYVTDSRKGSNVTVGDTLGNTTPSADVKKDTASNGASESKPAAAPTAPTASADSSSSTT